MQRYMCYFDTNLTLILYKRRKLRKTRLKMQKKSTFSKLLSESEAYIHLNTILKDIGTYLKI